MPERLIDAEALKLSLPVAYGSVTDAIDNTPTVDAVRVVRCKDCMYYQDNNGGYPHPDCRWGHDETPDEDDYCSFGAKMDEEGENNG